MRTRSVLLTAGPWTELLRGAMPLGMPLGTLLMTWSRVSGEGRWVHGLGGMATWVTPQGTQVARGHTAQGGTAGELLHTHYQLSCNH